MSSHTIHTRSRTILIALAAILLAAFGALASASPALAHDELVSTDPAPDASLAELPEALTLTFSSEIADDEGANLVQVTDADGANLAGGTLSVRDNVLTQPLAGTASGEITVLWKVVSSDGHPISGEFSFTVVAPEPSETPLATLTASPTPLPTASATPTDTASPTAAPLASSNANVWPLALIVLLAVGLTAAIVYLLVSRRRHQAALAEARNGASDPSAER